MLPHHPPEVSHCVFHGPLGQYVLVAMLVALCVGRVCVCVCVCGRVCVWMGVCGVCVCVGGEGKGEVDSEEETWYTCNKSYSGVEYP